MPIYSSLIFIKVREFVKLLILMMYHMAWATKLLIANQLFYSIYMTPSRRRASKQGVSYLIYCFILVKVFHSTHYHSYPSHRMKVMAETKGFEPSNESPRYSLSRGAPSTTRPRLRGRVYLIYLYTDK
jgi:hypothetical protein